jgi:hypothetical protein
VEVAPVLAVPVAVPLVGAPVPEVALPVPVPVAVAVPVALVVPEVSDLAAHPEIATRVRSRAAARARMFPVWPMRL